MMAHAERCPICNGRGYINEVGFVGTVSIGSDTETKCHGCNGKGWVEVEDLSSNHLGLIFKTDELIKDSGGIY